MWMSMTAAATIQEARFMIVLPARVCLVIRGMPGGYPDRGMQRVNLIPSHSLCPIFGQTEAIQATAAVSLKSVLFNNSKNQLINGLIVFSDAFS